MITIEVIQKHMDRSRGHHDSRSISFNPLALATCDALDKPEGSVRVATDGIELIGMEKVPLPDNASSELQKWNLDLAMAPFTFEIEKPKEKSEPS